MERWARVVFDLLRPAGQLYLFEFHPLRWIFGEKADGPEIRDAYFTLAEGYRAGSVTYAEATASLPVTYVPRAYRDG
jgi:hypothetical protein